MRFFISAVVSVALLLGGPAVAAQDASEPASEATQRLTLPGYEASIDVPAVWSVEPLIGGPFTQRLHPTSPFTVRMWTGAAGGEDPAGCYFFAYSRPGCAAPVDLDAELGGIGPPWEALPAAPAAFIGEKTLGEWTSVRHFASDGADILEVKCGGETVPGDGWGSIAQSLRLPEQPRPDRVAAERRGLAQDVYVTNSMWSDANVGTLVFEGDGFRERANKRSFDPRVVAAIDALARPAKTVTIDQRIHRDADGEDVLTVDTIRARKADLATKADPKAVREAMFAFAEAEWEESREGEPTLETVPLGHYQATRATFGDGAAPEYIIASGNSVTKLHAATDEIAQSWLEALPCHHLDVYRIITDVLIENRPDR